MKALLGMLLLFALTACAHHPPQVDCEGRLTPINPPNPVVKSPEAAKRP